MLLNPITFTYCSALHAMTITLQNIIPIPLRDKLQNRASDVWNREVTFSCEDWVKMKAPSGSGKTTLVHILWNLRKDFTGTVKYNQQPTHTLSAEALAIFRQQHLSVIFQDLRLFGQLTALENIELKRQMVNKPYCDEHRVKQMAEALGVAAILHQPAATCSYGEQQRIAIIRALVQPFELLIMDEPFSHLDNANAQKAADLISAECKQRGAGMLVTDLEEDHLFAYNKHLQL